MKVAMVMDEHNCVSIMLYLQTGYGPWVEMCQPPFEHGDLCHGQSLSVFSSPMSTFPWLASLYTIAVVLESTSGKHLLLCCHLASEDVGAQRIEGLTDNFGKETICMIPSLGIHVATCSSPSVSSKFSREPFMIATPNIHSSNLWR